MTTDRYIKLRNDRDFTNHYYIIIHKSFNCWNIQSDIPYFEFVNGATKEISSNFNSCLLQSDCQNTNTHLTVIEVV